MRIYKVSMQLAIDRDAFRLKLANGICLALEFGHSDNRIMELRCSNIHVIFKI